MLSTNVPTMVEHIVIEHFCPTRITFRWAQSQGYTGTQLPDSGSLLGQYPSGFVYFYSYLGGKVIHYKLDGGNALLNPI